jgi:hypothetical protein
MVNSFKFLEKIKIKGESRDTDYNTKKRKR